MGNKFVNKVIDNLLVMGPAGYMGFRHGAGIPTPVDTTLIISLIYPALRTRTHYLMNEEIKQRIPEERQKSHSYTGFGGENNSPSFLEFAFEEYMNHDLNKGFKKETAKTVGKVVAAYGTGYFIGSLIPK
jgi:hypothetical protein